MKFEVNLKSHKEAKSARDPILLAVTGIHK